MQLLNINQIHKIYLHTLSVVDSICRKNNIKYHLDAGTLIGAVRHKGFIPWDDDVDISMTRDDYNKFKEICKDELKKNDMIFVEPYENKNNFHDFISRIYYIKEPARDDECFIKYFDGRFQYLWIDIFIYDKIDIKNKWLFFLEHKIVYGLAMGHRIKPNFSRCGSFLLKFFAFSLSTIGKLVPLKMIYDWHKKLIVKYNDFDMPYVYCGNGSASTLEYVDELAKKIDLIDIEFENIKLPVLRDYDVYLRYFYGDYTKLPPIEKQHPTHITDSFF